MSDLRSSLTPYAHLMREPQRKDAVEAARNAYHASGKTLVLINEDWLESWADKQQLHLLAERALGVKGKRV